jgi:hypothetical protein
MTSIATKSATDTTPAISVPGSILFAGTVTTGKWTMFSLNSSIGTATTNIYNSSTQPATLLGMTPTVDVSTSSTTGYAEIFSQPIETSISSTATNYFIYHKNAAGTLAYAVNEAGAQSTIGQITTAGNFGAVPIVASPTRLTGQTASLGPTNLQCGGAVCAAGTYEIVFSAVTTTAGTLGDTLTLNCNNTDDGGNETQSSLAYSLSASAPSAAFSYTCIVYTTGVNNIAYSTTVSSTAGSPAYSLSVIMKRLQ